MFQRFSPESLQVLVKIKSVYFKDDYCYEEMIRSQFNMIRNQKTNGVDLQTFRNFIHNKADNVPDMLIDDMFRIFDKNGSGIISEGEFSYVFQQIRTMTQESLQSAINQRQSQTNLKGANQYQYQQQQQLYKVNCVVSPINNGSNGPSQGYGNNQIVNVHLNIPENHNNIIFTSPPGTSVGQLFVNNQDITQAQNTPQQYPPHINNPLFNPQPQNQNAQNVNNKYPNLSNQQSQQNLAKNVQQNQQQQQQQNQYLQQQQREQLQKNQMQQQQQQMQQQNNPNPDQNPQKLKYPTLDIKNKAQTNSTETATAGGGNGFSKEETNRIVNGLINPSAGDTHGDDVLRDVDQLRSVRVQAVQQKADPVYTMVLKLAEVKKGHLEGKYDVIRNLKNFHPSGKMSFTELVFFFESLGINFSPEEKEVIKEQCDYSGSAQNRFITTKELLAFLNLNDYYVSEQNQKQQPPAKKPQIFVPSPQGYQQQQQNQQLRQQEQQNAQRKMEQQDQRNFLQVQQQEQYKQHIDLLKSSIQTKFYFESESPNLKGYKEFVTIFKNLDSTKQPFFDSDFKAVTESIVTDHTSPLFGKQQQFQWLRPSEFSNFDTYEMFGKIQSVYQSRIGLGKLISPYDIEQGTLGDCYFLSAVSSLAQEPQRILDLFVTRIVNPYGIYCVKICHDGEWKAVFVDDRIPCTYKKPAFTRSSTKEIWVSILEKAWAKLFNGYANIESGYCREALRDLTGAPTKTIHNREEVDQEDAINYGGQVLKKEVFNDTIPIILQDALSKQNKFVVTAGADDEAIITKSIGNDLGLVSSHAYSIIGVKTIIHPQTKREVILLKMRNPWGKKEWKGDWGDGSALWTAQLREQLKVKSRDDGIFFMAMSDFQRYFSDVSICYYHDHFKYVSIPLRATISQNHHIQSQYTRMTVREPGIYYISIVQRNKRLFEKSQGYAYCASRLLIINDRDAHCVGKILKIDREVFLQCNLVPGTYTIQSKIFVETKLTYSYVVSSYGEAEVKFEPIGKQAIPKDLIKNCFLELARLNTEKTKFSKGDGYEKCVSLNLKEGYGYYYIRNKNKHNLMEITTKFENTKGIKLAKPHRIPSISLTILPQNEVIIPITISVKGYSYKCQESYKISNI